MEKFKQLLLLFFLMTISVASAQTNYCATPISSTNPSGTYSVDFTCRKVSGTTYEYKLEFAVAVGIANANIAADNVNPGGTFNIGGNLVLSNGNKTASVQFDSSTTPNVFVNYLAVTMAGVAGVVEWNQLPTNENFAATCGGGGLPAPTFGTFTVPSKVLGDAPFALTAPSSNSAGAITFTSSNTGVATISGSTVTVVGGGSSTITANQAASATHSAGSTTATLVVTIPNTTPTSGPTTPPARNPWDVLSQYGSAYTNQTGVYFDSFGGANIVGDVTLGDGSVVKKYTNHNYSGISPNGANNLNVSAMTHMHIDVWSPNFASFKIKLEAVNGSNRELEVAGAKAQGVWNSYDIPLTNYTTGAGAVDLTSLKWIVPVTYDPNNTTLYITNVYFYRPATTQPPTLGTFTVPAKNVGDAAFALTPPSSNSSGAFTYTSSNTNVATISGNILTIVSGGTSTITANQAATGTNGPGSATATFVASYPTPGASPTPPARDSSDVVSMFTGTPTVYANSVNAVRADWSNGATTITPVPNGTNTALRVDNMGYFGLVQTSANFSIVGMTKLHVDVYLNNPLPSLFIFLLAPTDNIYTATNLGAGWNSLDIDLSNYTSAGANLADIYGLKFESNSSPSAFQMYLDNIYFYVPAGIDPTITDFNISAKVLGDAPFELAPPTSNSTGAFTYTSSNTSVATISGSTVTVVGAGTSTITAFQAANGAYEAGSVTASLVVANPPLATAAPTPPARNAWDVISLYSNTYATSSAPTWQNAASTTDEVLEGNDTKKMSNFLVEFINFTPTDLTAMTTLHMDVYSEDCTGMNIWLLNNGDRNAQITLVPNQWNSINIPMSTYLNAGLILNGVSQLKFESLNGPGKTVYVDNIYFYRPATSLPPTLADFSVPAQPFGASPFTLTAPTSNSNGAFTYTSSNLSVATISGSTVTVVGPGTSTITATQAANGTYGSASISATLVVAFPTPGASPIPPAREPERVVSMYTGTPSTYSNAITAARSAWTGATTLTEVPNGTNTALRLDNFGFLGLVDQNETHFSVEGMSHLHLDVYLNEPLNSNPALSRLFIYLLSNGDHLYEATNLVTGWNSLSIPLSNFPGATLSDIYGLKFEQNTSSPTQIYIDNIYFSNECYTYYADADADGFGDATNSLFACAPTPGYILNNTDCNDAVAAINPAHAEVNYNGFDDNCDGNLDEGFQLLSNVITQQCGITLTAINSVIQVTTVPNITKYRYRVYNVVAGAVQLATVQYVERAQPYFTFTNMASFDYATTYSIQVEMQRNGIWLGYYGSACQVSTPALLDNPNGSGAINPSLCGQTLATISTLIATPSLQSATAYKFRVSNNTDPLAPGQVQEIERSQNYFALTMLPYYFYGTTYNIEVSVKTNGQFSGYGSVCPISSPAVPMINNCEQHMAQPVNYISTSSLNKVVSYRFEVSLVDSNDNPVSSTTVDRSLSYFNFNMVPNYVHGGKYMVRVALRTTGFHSPFGEACFVYAPVSLRQNGSQQVEVITSRFDATVFPNPYAESFSLDFDSTSEEKIQLRVYDMIGKLIEDRSFESTQIELAQFGEKYPSGVYNIILTQSGNVKTLRVIKR